MAAIRNEPATGKQKEKLRYFGFSDPDGMTKGQASDALDDWVRRFPEKNKEYYDRPATEEQLTKLRAYLAADGETAEDYADGDGRLSYGRAKELIRECELEQRQKREEEEGAYDTSEDGRIDHAMFDINNHFFDYREVSREEVAKAWAVVRSRLVDRSKYPSRDEVFEALLELFADYRASKTVVHTDTARTIIRLANFSPPTEAQIKVLEESGFNLDPGVNMSSQDLDSLLSLEYQAPRPQDLALLAQHGIINFQGDGFAAYGLTVLVRYFVEMSSENCEFINLFRACQAAMDDPAYSKATVSLDKSGFIIFKWPEVKLKKWYRTGK